MKKQLSIILGIALLVPQSMFAVTSVLKQKAFNAAYYTSAFTAGVAATAAAIYGTYWACTAKTRQELKFLRKRLEPEIPTVETGLNKKAKYRLFNWKVSEYPTVVKIKEIRQDRTKLNVFLNDLASDIINNEFKDVDPDLCKNNEGQPVMNMHGVQLTQEGARQMLLNIQKEKAVLGNVLEALQGNMALADVEDRLNELIDGRKKSENNGLTSKKAYLASDGFPIKKWLGLGYILGLKGNAFTFNYAEEYKTACILAGFKSEVIPKLVEMSPAQYAIVDNYMNERTKVSNNKMKFFRGYVYYGQAARLYWDTYKKIHRLEAIENILNTELHGLIPTGRPAAHVVYIR